MIRKSYKNILIFEFPNLSQFPEIRHGIFSRKGGGSPFPYNSLNLSFRTGDKDEFVKENRKLVLESVEGTHLISVKQIHSADVIVLKKSQKMSVETYGDANDITIGEADAIITDVEGINLLIKVADCQSVILYDPKKRVVANIHSGWRGSVQNIIGCTLEKMRNDFGCRMTDIYAGIGPSLGPCCAEFVNYKKEIPEKYWKYKDENSRFDFWNISLEQLCESGVKKDNICFCQMCTKCNTDLFFSYRKDHVTGRFGAVIGLR